MKKKKNSSKKNTAPKPLTSAQKANIRKEIAKIKICARTHKPLDENTAILIKIYYSRYLLSTIAICPEEADKLPQIKANIKREGFTARFMTNNKSTILP
jgi:3-deoxy-D-manno-octulosonic-acid transferase